MPTPISAALGTERQFTPQPEHGYVGQYVGVSPVNVSASTAHDDQLAQNFAQLGAALTSYRVSHERYLSETGHIDSERMIKGMTEADIKKLNAIDAAQQEGFADCLSNPYFKAHAEKLRGGFLSTVMKNQYDEKYALTPARSAEEEANRYRKFSQDWQSANLSGDKAPINEIAFNTGFNENQLVNMANLMGTWEKKNYENEVTTVMAASTSKLNDIVENSAELLKTNGEMTAKAKEVANEVRLMGLPLQFKIKLFTDFGEQLIKTGHLDEKRLGQMMDNIVIQTNLDGSEMRASDLLPMMQFRTMAAEYNRQFHTQEDYNWMQSFIKKGRAGLMDAMKTVDGERITDPELARKHNAFIPYIQSKVEQQENDAKRLRYNMMRAKGKNAGAKNGSRGAVKDGETINDILSGVLNGDDMVGGLPINSYNFDKDALYSIALPLAQQLTADENWEGLNRLMNYSKLKDLRGSISDNLATTLAQIRPSDDGGVNIGGNLQLMAFVKAIATNPNAAAHTFGGALATEGRKIQLFTDMYGGGDDGFAQGLRLYAESNDTAKQNPDLHTSNVTAGRNNIAGYTIDGVANFGGYSDEADFGYNCNRFVANELGQFWTALLDTGMPEEAVQRQMNQLVRQQYGTYHYSVFPKNVYYNMGTDNNAVYFRKGLDAAIWATLGADGTTADAETITLTFNPNTRVFDIYSSTADKHASFTTSQIRDYGMKAYEKDTNEGTPDPEASTLDMDKINEARSVPKQFNNADSYDDPSILDEYESEYSE